MIYIYIGIINIYKPTLQLGRKRSSTLHGHPLVFRPGHLLSPSRTLWLRGARRYRHALDPREFRQLHIDGLLPVGILWSCHDVTIADLSPLAQKRMHVGCWMFVYLRVLESFSLISSCLIVLYRLIYIYIYTYGGRMLIPVDVGVSSHLSAPRSQGRASCFF